MPQVFPFQACSLLESKHGSKNVTEEEILDAFHAITSYCDIHEAKAPLVDVHNLMELEPRDPVTKSCPNHKARLSDVFLLSC